MRRTGQHTRHEPATATSPGKTTTIRLLLDFLRPTRGGVTMLGLDPRRDKATLHRQIGYLPGELAFPGREKAADLL